MEPTLQTSYDESSQSNPDLPEQSQPSEPPEPPTLIPRPKDKDWNRPRSVLTSIGLEGFVQQKRVQERAYPPTSHPLRPPFYLTTPGAADVYMTMGFAAFDKGWAGLPDSLKRQACEMLETELPREVSERCEGGWLAEYLLARRHVVERQKLGSNARGRGGEAGGAGGGPSS